MARKSIAVLDFSSSHISVMIGEREMGGFLGVKGFGQVSYAGFMDGEFLQPQTLSQEIGQAISLAMDEAKCQITHLYIGAPAEFCAVVTKKANLDFFKRHKINDKDISLLFDTAEDFDTEDFTIINRAPIYYVLDDGYKIIKPKGKISESIEGMISFVICKNQFLQIVKQAVANFGFVTKFFGRELSEVLYLIGPEQRDNCAILLDSGFLSSSVSVTMGDGLVDLKSFSLGTGHIVADFCEAFGLSVDESQQLLSKISLTDKQEEIFEIETDDFTKEIESSQIYEIVEYRIKQIANTVNKCLSQCENLPNYLPVLITGDGIGEIDGALDVLKEVLNRDVSVIKPSDERFANSKLSAPASLLDLALKENKESLGTLIIKFFKKN